jgi:integrase
MPRQSKGARLWLKPEERDKAGRLRKRATWVIRDGARRVVTGCAAGERVRAEEALGEYITSKYQPGRERDSRAAEVLVTDVLAIYQNDIVPSHARPEKSIARIEQLSDFWEGKTLADVTGASCRAYAAFRTAMPIWSAKPEVTGNPARMVTPQAVRRELEDLRAAINHHRKEGYSREVVEVVLPPKGASRELWLNRSQMATLLWTCWKTKETQGGKETGKYPLRHLVPFILAGRYTGTRPGAICDAALRPFMGHGYIDAENGVWYRRKIGRRETKKRQPPVRLPGPFVAHLRRWIASGRVVDWLVTHGGQRVAEVNKGIARAVKLANLDPAFVPHVITRHTCATWLMQNGADLWDAADFLGMTVRQLEATYGHHHPDHQKSAADALTGRRRA